jgi:hypothetical protein
VELSVISFLIGILLYSLHFLLLENAVTWFTVWLVGRFHPHLFPETMRKKGGSYMTLWLVQERWSRPVSKNPRAQSHQIQLDRHYAWLIFGYCMAYGAAIVGCDAYCHKLYFAGLVMWLGGVVFLIGALITDYRVTYYEAWLSTVMQQNGTLYSDCV